MLFAVVKDNINLSLHTLHCVIIFMCCKCFHIWQSLCKCQTQPPLRKPVAVFVLPPLIHARQGKRQIGLCAPLRRPYGSIHLNARGLRSRPIHSRPCLSGFKTKVSVGKVGVIAGVQVCVHTNVPMCRCMSVSMSVWDCLRHSECESGWGHVIERQNRKHNLAE